MFSRLAPCGTCERLRVREWRFGGLDPPCRADGFGCGVSLMVPPLWEGGLAVFYHKAWAAKYFDGRDPEVRELVRGHVLRLTFSKSDGRVGVDFCGVYLDAHSARTRRLAVAALASSYGDYLPRAWRIVAGDFNYTVAEHDRINLTGDSTWCPAEWKEDTRVFFCPARLP